MSVRLDGHRLTLIINSTAVDDDSLRRISNEVKILLDEMGASPPEVSTTTVFQAIPTTVTVIDTQTTTVATTATLTRTRVVVPTATFRLSSSLNQIFSSATGSLDIFPTEPLLPIPTSSTSPSTVPNLPSSVLPPTSTGFSSDISTSPPSTASSTTPTTSPATSPTLPADASSISPSPLASKKELPSGGIVGIVIACLVFFLFLGIYIARWRLRRKRSRNRSWITPFVAEKPVLRVSVNQRQQKRMEYIAERWQRLRNSRRNRRAQAVNADSGLSRGNNGPSRRNREVEQVPAPPPAYQESSAGRPVQDELVSSVFPNGAVAKLRFEPNKRDELLVRPGDYLKVLTLFDDGWSLCKNNSGEKGMVPTSCLRVNRVGRMGQSWFY